jgi:hypothetical protein
MLHSVAHRAEGTGFAGLTTASLAVVPAMLHCQPVNSAQSDIFIESVQIKAPNDDIS